MTSQVKIELRSDTFTKPCKKMLEAMFSAEVGDCQYDEDPTVLKLESTVAELFGKEAALFVPSGTMANLISIMVHCNNERASEIIVGDLSHINLWEQGSASHIGGVYVRQIKNLDDGTFNLNDLETMLTQFDPTDPHCVITKLVCIENTHNWCGGKVLPLDFLDNLHDLCVKHNVKLHLDGSRLMNASVAANVSLKEFSKHCDSVNFCFSKGLGAPVGSIIVGSQDYINKANRMRKCLGGTMRQTGYLAAACLFGLNQAEEKLKIDHENARNLALGIDKCNRGIISVDVEKTKTNIVLVTTKLKNLSSSSFISRLDSVTEEESKELGKSIIVKGGKINQNTLRLVCHLGVSSEQIELALKKIDYVCKEYASKTEA